MRRRGSTGYWSRNISESDHDVSASEASGSSRVWNRLRTERNRFDGPVGALRVRRDRMFLPAHRAAAKSARPPDSSISASDWKVLAAFWHPVALSSAITDRPLGVRLLDLSIVLFRASDGLKAALDQCPHRGARLSLGVMRDGLLVCGFHGLHYNGTGACVRIPSIAADAPIPRRVCLTTYLCVERYGLVWVCLSSEPRAPLPEWRSLEDGSGTVVGIEPYYIEASAGRRVENFNDVTHVPFVHTGTFGGPGAVVAAYDVEVTEQTLSFTVPILEQVRYVADGSNQP